MLIDGLSMPASTHDRLHRVKAGMCSCCLSLKNVYRMLACTGLPRIPAGTLTNQHKQVTLPLYLPELLVVEPWVESDPVKVTAARGGKVEVQWEGSSRWVEVNIGLIGELVSLGGCPGGGEEIAAQRQAAWSGRLASSAGAAWASTDVCC
jgi:hypothetical protein